MASKTESPVIAAQGLQAGEEALLADLCAEQGWTLGPPAGAAVVVLGPDGDPSTLPAAIEVHVKAGRQVLGVLERLGAAQVAPSQRAGAADFLVRPFDRSKAGAVLRRALELGDLSDEIRRAENSLWQGLPATRMAGESPALLAALGAAAQAADYPVDVLILGETGTGKELLARVVHERSGRRLAPFVAVDCGAIHEDLADSLLFGHRRGAFTGAVTDHVGLLEQADGGTLFLDEIGNLSAAVQAKLLRALQNREVWRLGDTSARPVDIRVLAATHADLEQASAQGRFRSDLYHRLADLRIVLPPLRERGGDITLLARLFLDRHRSRFGLGPCNLSAAALAKLEAFHWPGNVRQLENSLKQAAVLAEAEVLPEHLPQEVLSAAPRPAEAPKAAASEGLELPEGILPLWELEQRVTEQVERRAILAALQAAAQDRDQAAKLLDLHPKTLARKMRAHGL
jgi:DNA-binding NtrC family response regulator